MAPAEFGLNRKQAFGKYILWSLLGGFIGSWLMVLTMKAAGSILHMPPAVLLRAIGVMLGADPANFGADFGLGLTVHLLLGTFVFTTAMLAVSLAVGWFFFIMSIGRGVIVGLIAGIILYFIWGLPFLMRAMAPAAVKAVAFTMQLPAGKTVPDIIPSVKRDLSMNLRYVAMFFFVAHVIYGVIWGLLTGVGALLAGAKNATA